MAFPFGLKSKIFITLAILLILAMVLIDLVMIATLQKELLRTEIARGQLVVNTLEQHLLDLGTSEEKPNEWTLQGEVVRLQDAVGFTELVLVDPTGRVFHFGPLKAPLRPKLESLARKALNTKLRERQFLGTTWGVFWKRAKYMAHSAPLYSDGAAAAAMSMALPLDGIYQQLRAIQGIIIVYILINAGLLSIIGLLRISRVAVRPVLRLLKRAESFQEDDTLLFLSEKGESEFNRLSKALNRLFQRISDDRETLRQTVQTLESTNIDLKKAQKDIIQAEKLASVGRLSSGIAHEIGNPIGIIVGYLDLLKQSDLPDEERSEYIQRAEDEIQRISMILRQLLDFSRPSSGELDAVAVHDVLDDLVGVVQVQPLVANISVNLDKQAGKDRVMADANQLRQVFLNLIINAADATAGLEGSRDGTLVVRSETQNRSGSEKDGSREFLKLMFIDNGPGIPDEHLDTIFDPFFTTKAPGKGTGLGLSVCFMIVESLGGRILAASRKGEGTTMTIFLPVIPEQKDSRTQGLPASGGAIGDQGFEGSSETTDHY